MLLAVKNTTAHNNTSELLDTKTAVTGIYLQLFTMLHNPTSVTSQHQLSTSPCRLGPQLHHQHTKQLKTSNIMTTSTTM